MINKPGKIKSAYFATLNAFQKNTFLIACACIKRKQKLPKIQFVRFFVEADI